MKKAQRFFICICLCLLAIVTIFPADAAAVVFSDVDNHHWASADIKAMEQRGIIQGSSEKFRPQEPVSNQAFLAMVCRASGLDDRKLETHWTADPIIAYGQYFDWFGEEELTQTNRAKPITREFAAKLLISALFPDFKTSAEPIRFADASSISHDRFPYVQAAASLGLITGYKDHTFRPQDNLTRAAAAALLNRALQKKESAEIGKTVQVPLLMYHDVSYLGKGYSKTPEIFRKQMQELKDAGFHTITYHELIDFVENNAPLPDKPIIISVDDGYHSNYEYLYPILDELDMKAEIALIGGAIQYARWGLTWDEVREMSQSGHVFFQAHTYQMHGDHTKEGGRLGVLRAKNETWSEYIELLGTDTTRILEKIEKEVGTRPEVFVYPRGKWNLMAEAIVTRLGCKASVTTKDGIAKVTQGNPDSLHLMDRIGMDFRNGSVVSVLKEFGYSA